MKARTLPSILFTNKTFKARFSSLLFFAIFNFAQKPSLLQCFAMFLAKSEHIKLGSPSCTDDHLFWKILRQRYSKRKKEKRKKCQAPDRIQTHVLLITRCALYRCATTAAELIISLKRLTPPNKPFNLCCGWLSEKKLFNHRTSHHPESL